MAKKKQLCTFFLDDQFFGVEVNKVQEIIPYRAMTPVPLASPIIRGLINLRGQIVTAIDLRRRLHLSEFPEDKLPMNIILRTEGEAISLLIDAIGDVLELNEDIFELPPETLKGSIRECIVGAYKLDKRLLLELDTNQVLNLDWN